MAAAVELFAGSNNLRYYILHSSIHLLSTSGCGGFFLQPLVILPLYFSNPYLTVNCATAAQPNECERTNGGVECTTAKHPLEKERNNLTIMHLLLLFILPPEFPPSKLEKLFFIFTSKLSCTAFLSVALFAAAMMMLTLNRSLLYVAKSPVVANSSTTSSLVPVSH